MMPVGGWDSRKRPVRPVSHAETCNPLGQLSEIGRRLPRVAVQCDERDRSIASAAVRLVPA